MIYNLQLSDYNLQQKNDIFSKTFY
jgi:hypothetical protein